LSIPNELREFDRTAVLTIQGGGVYGLSLLGQVGAVVNRLEIEPLALAGTSAGAIVATLLWAGYRPKDIRQKFINLTRPGSVPSLIDLLGPFEPQAAPFDWTAFQKLDEESRKVWGVIKSANELVGEKTNIFVRGFKAPGRLKQAWQAKNLIVRFARDNQVHVNNRGIFRGKQLEDRIDDWLRSATRLRAYAAKLPRDRPLSFGDIHDVAKKNPEATFVPLFLAATNLSQRRLELFNSLDLKYREVPIARAVLASAGVPFFFRPVKIVLDQKDDWFVDGGAISNYPAWVFSHELRRRLADSEEHRALASRPWVHIGLRLGPDSAQKPQEADTPKGFLNAAVDLVSGRARDELEGVLSSFVARSWTVRQPVNETAGPDNFLQVNELDEKTILAMYSKGEDLAASQLASMSFTLPAQAAVNPLLADLVELALLVLGQPNNDAFQLRSNVFLPRKEGLKLHYSFNMDDPETNPDHDMEFPEFTMGLTGFCFSMRQPLICNLEEIRRLSESGGLEPNELFGMPPHLHQKVRVDRSWLASVPIFDPYATYPRDLSSHRALQRHPEGVGGQSYHPLRTTVDGAVLGVLNLDARLPYDELKIDPAPLIHWQHPSIQAIIRFMESVAQDLGRTFSDAFARPS